MILECHTTQTSKLTLKRMRHYWNRKYSKYGFNGLNISLLNPKIHLSTIYLEQLEEQIFFNISEQKG